VGKGIASAAPRNDRVGKGIASAVPRNDRVGKGIASAVPRNDRVGKEIASAAPRNDNMNKVLAALLSFPVCLMIAAGCFAAGTDPSAFLSYGAGGRAFGLGGAYAGISEDATATYYNPAALGALQYKQLLTSYSTLWENTDYSYAGYTHPLVDAGALGFNIVRLYSGGAERRDIYNKPQGNFDHSRTGITVGYGKGIYKNIYAGLNGKFINSVLDTNTANYFSVDVAGYYRINHVLSIGANLQNVIPITMSSTDDRLPLNFKMGAGYKVFGDKVLFAVDLNKNSGRSSSIIDFYSLGLESRPFNFLSFRLGKNVHEVTAGFGLKQSITGIIFSLDYAVAMHDYLGVSHRASLDFRFGRSIEEIKLARKTQEDSSISEPKPEEIMIKEQKEDKFRALYQDAVESYKQGLFSIALEKFNAAKEILPEDTLVPVYIERLGTIVGVITQHISSGKAGDLLRRGVAYFVEGDGESAVKTIAYLLSIEPENFTVERLLNRLEEKTGIKAEKSTPMTNLSVVEQKLYECLIHFKKRDFWKAISLCEQILVLEPDNVAAYKRMGSAFYALGEKEKAKEVWQKALLIQPDPKLKDFIEKMK
ncbi:MAG: PorV/PorQ family protein, partial [Elusimicrobia bacterium]|nr:PorV/PorQ family protein [Elusimicrobiota bacterium]